MQLFRGLHYALRRLARAPLFTSVAIVTLAVGIGANAAIFSVVYAVLLKPLPFDEPERLVGVWHTAPGLGVPLMNQGPATYLTYREENRVFDDIGLWDGTMVSVTGRGEPERLDALVVTDGTLPVLRVRPYVGRRFSREDDTPGSPERVMLSYGYWQRKFSGNPAAIGQGLVVDGRPREIIGVLPPGFRFERRSFEIVLPERLNRAEVFVGDFSYQAVARLKPGVSRGQANADIARMLPHVLDKFPLPPGFTRQMFNEVRMGPNVRPLADDVIGDVGRLLWVLLGTVGMVLLIACVNVANLFLVRAESRQQELAVRAALGASRGRIARELLSESVTLGLVGGAAGVGLAYLGLQVLVALRPEGLPRLDEIGINVPVLLFTLGLSLGAGVLFGLIPVVKFWRPRLSALKEGGRSASDSRERHRARSALVVSEIALALVLLIGYGLMVRTFQAMRRVEPGFVSPEQVLTFRLSIPEALVADPEQTIRLHEQIAHRLERVPGVRAVAITSSNTMDGHDSADPVFVEDHPGPPGRIPPIRRFKWVSPSFFEAMGRRTIAGRTFTWADTYAASPIAIVSENFARLYWKDPAGAVGKRIRQSPDNPWREVVGVAGDERDDGLARPAPAIVYWPLLLHDFWTEKVYLRRTLSYAVRSDRLGSPTFLKEAQQAVWSVSPSLPLAEVRTLDEIRAESMAQTSFMLVMLAIAAFVALLLGVVGIYGVIAYIAAQRTREIGIRMALGAAEADVSRLFVRHGLVLTAAGLMAGLAAAAALTRLMGAILFGVAPFDPATYAVVALALAVVAGLASYLPARRAARIEPNVALRADGKVGQLTATADTRLVVRPLRCRAEVRYSYPIPRPGRDRDGT